MTVPESMRRDLGSNLRRLREGAGYSGRDLARVLDWSPSKVSKLETGKQTAVEAEIIAWCRATAASEANTTGLLHRLRELRDYMAQQRQHLRTGYHDREDEIAALEHSATRIRTFDNVAIPALLQTADYARRVFTVQADLLAVTTEVEYATLARLKRQQVLYDSRKQIEIVLCEAALAHPLVGPVEMIVQLHRLLSAVELPHVRLGILPLYRCLPHLPVHGYRMLDQHVLIDNITARCQIVDADQVETHHLWTTPARLADLLLHCNAEPLIELQGQ